MNYTLEVIERPRIPDTWLRRAKHQCRIEAEENYDDRFLCDLIEDAHDYIAERADSSFLETKYRLTVERFPTTDLPVYLLRPPLVSVDSITYRDPAGDLQTIEPANYRIADGSRSELYNVDGYWPIAKCVGDAVQINYTAGAATQRPALRAIMLLVGHWYMSREDTTEMRLSNIPHGVDVLTEHLRPGDEFRKPIPCHEDRERYGDDQYQYHQR